MTDPAPRAGSDLLDARITPRKLRLGDVAYRTYLVFLAVPLAVVYGAQVIDLAANLFGFHLPLMRAAAGPGLRSVLTAAGAVALLLVAHTAVWRTPITLERGDVTWLLTSPLPRRVVLQPRVVHALARGAGIGAAAGAVTGALAADVLGGAHLPTAAGGALAGATLGVVGQAAAWWVLCDTRRGVLTVRLAAVGVVAVVGVLAAGVWAPTLVHAIAWSGPWGWPAVTISASAMGALPEATAALALSLTAAGAAWWWAKRAAGAPSAEEFARRAHAHAGVQAAGYLYDYRAVLDMRREALQRLRGPPRVRLPPPRGSALAIAWRDATALARTPGRAAAGFTAALAAGALASLAAGQAVGSAASDADAAEMVLRAAAMAAAAIVVAQAAVRVLSDPLRSAIAQPFGHAFLPWAHAALVRRHMLVPACVFVLGGAAGTTLSTLISLSGGPRAAAWPAALGVLCVTPLLAGSAGHAGLQAPDDPDAAFVAMMTEYGALAQSLRGWPTLLAFLGCMVPVTLAILAAGTAGRLAFVLFALVWCGSSALLGWWLLNRRNAPWDADQSH